MMKSHFLSRRGFASSGIFLFCLQLLSAQWYDANWVLGYGNMDGSGGSDTTFRMDFANGGMALEIKQNPNMWLPGPLSFTISDSAGKLQFYTNGARVADSTGMLLSGGDSLMFGSYIRQLYYQYPTFLTPEAMTIIPWPDAPGRYAVIYSLYDYQPGILYRSDHVYCRIIDMNQGTNGAVWPGQDTILSGTGFELGQIAGTKHANGRDWWVLIRENYPSHTYHRLLLTPEGWRRYPVIEAGEGLYGFNDEVPPSEFFSAQDVLFTPDGSKHIRVGPNELYIFDFDRCSGILSNFRRKTSLNISYGASVAISTNSRYLYWCGSEKLYQFDLQDTTNGEVVVAETSGQTAFIFAQLAADGKIYINGGSTTNTMHVIMQPDSPGVACDVVQDAITLPGYARGFPNYPNYRLGPVPGGGCDSTPGGVLLGVAPPALPSRASGNPQVWPNPAREQAMIALPAVGSGELRLLSATGSVVKLLTFSQVATLRLDLAGVPAGVYVCEVRTQEGNLFTHKLMILP